MQTSSLLERAQALPDPRQASKCSHILGDVVFITLCGLLCGADDWNAIVYYAKEKEDWLRQHLSLPNGIPSHDTFNRIFALLAPDTFHQLFTDWVQDVLLGNSTITGVVAIDGKTQRGSRVSATEVTHTINAWSVESGICLGQNKVADKSNEITAVPLLLKQLAIKNCLVTADAMSCQKKIAQQIISQEADYLLAVKANQKQLFQTIDSHFVDYWQCNPNDSSSDKAFSEQDEGTHGRTEHRRCWVSSTVSDELAQKWGAQTIAAVQYDRVKGKSQRSYMRYFISSRVLSADEVLLATRQHWQVENSLHWVLDVAFCEDQSRARQGFAAENLATARQIALNLLKQDKTAKIGIKNRRKACGWSERYLEHILGLAIK